MAFNLPPGLTSDDLEDDLHCCGDLYDSEWESQLEAGEWKRDVEKDDLLNEKLTDGGPVSTDCK